MHGLSPDIEMLYNKLTSVATTGGTTQMSSKVLLIALALSMALVFIMFLSSSVLISVANADSVITTIPINKWPTDFALNSANGNVYVSQASTSVMSVIDGSSHSVIKSTTYPINYLYGAAYNPVNKNV